ncbi:hypothetical protein [Planktotalea sp.]|uniref:hypothetical protein n=1 Tax=Planktotalea sp. TaxID=2029877 RepID=UPI0025F75C00|nr:hypothetical protein [Planktotalea sp.]
MRFYAQLSHVVYALIEDDMPHKLFLSGGGHGMNIWVTFDAPKRVDVMKQLADFILKKAGLKRKAGGEFADAFVKNYDPGTRDDWAATGLCLQAAFGKENEWDRLSSASQYRPLPFCRFAGLPRRRVTRAKYLSQRPRNANCRPNGLLNVN